MKKLLVPLVLVLAVGICSMAAERKTPRDIDSDAFTNQTQVAFKGAGDDHLALAWWIPHEFWEALFARDTTTSETDKTAMLDTMSGTCLMAVVQADISNFGAFDYYSKELVESNVTLTYSDARGKSQKLVPLEEIDSDLEVLLGMFKPILGGAMGNLGNNMHFYVLSDKAKDSSRLLDPYQKGKITVKLARRDGTRMTAEIETPLDALFVPRKCPNGKDAHVSWNYCPWTGQRLED